MTGGTWDHEPEKAPVWHWNEWNRLRFNRWLVGHGYYRDDTIGLPDAPAVRAPRVGDPGDETAFDPAAAGSA